MFIYRLSKVYRVMKKIIILLILVNYCQSLHYEVPEDICKNDISAITLGNKVEFDGKSLPEITFFAQKSLWYYPDLSKEGYYQREWSQILLPLDMLEKGTEAYASFKRNFFNNWNECQSGNTSTQFVLIGLVDNQLSYNVYDVMNNSWTLEDSQPLYHLYLFTRIATIDQSKPINSALAWDQYIFIFQGANYSSIKVNQNPCDPNKSLSDTIQFWGSRPINEIDNDLNSIDSAIRYKNEENVDEFYIFQKEEVFYYNNPTIDQFGKLTLGQRLSTNKTKEGFFVCKKPRPITLPALEETSTSDENPTDESSDTADTDAKDETTTTISRSETTTTGTTKKGKGKEEKSFPKYLIVILVVSVIIALLICCFCCIFLKKSKKPTGEDQESGVKDSAESKDKSEGKPFETFRSKTLRSNEGIDSDDSTKKASKEPKTPRTPDGESAKSQEAFDRMSLESEKKNEKDSDKGLATPVITPISDSKSETAKKDSEAPKPSNSPKSEEQKPLNATKKSDSIGSEAKSMDSLDSNSGDSESLESLESLRETSSEGPKSSASRPESDKASDTASKISDSKGSEAPKTSGTTKEPDPAKPETPKKANSEENKGTSSADKKKR